MPEGDAIYRTARTLHRALAGHEVDRFESVLPTLTRVDEDAPLQGRTIERVEAAGKHVLMTFSGGLVLRTHMRMNGSWHIYRRGERWQRPRRDMRIVVATGAFEAVGFNIPVAEFLTPRDMKRQDDLRSMGPDLLGAAFDADEAVARLRARPALAVADAMLNQRLVAGIGNIYKSEILFICGVNPFTPMADVPEEPLRKVLATARKYLLVNATGPTGGIVTYRGYRRSARANDPSERRWVYGRARRPCRRCGTPIEVKPQGPDARLTYWCPHCQPGTRSG